MTDLLTFMALSLVCLTLAQLNIVLFGIIGRALRDKAILGDKEIIVVSSEDEIAEEVGDAEEPTEDAANEQQEAEETDANAAEENDESAQIAELAEKVAALATEVSTLAAKKQ